MVNRFTSDSYEDTCLYCGAHVGFGAPGFHIGICDEAVCAAKCYGPRWRLLLGGAEETAADTPYVNAHMARLDARHKAQKPASDGQTH